MSNTNEMQALVTRTEQLIGAITDAIISSTEVAAERISLAAQVARVQQRMTAFSAVLESIAVQKSALVERLASATGATKTLIVTQVSLLELQEIEVLKRAGVPEPAARQALTAADTTPASEAADWYVRDGRRFRRASTGTEVSRKGTGAGADGERDDRDAD